MAAGWWRLARGVGLWVARPWGLFWFDGLGRVTFPR